MTKCRWPECDREVKFAKKGLCERCYQRSRQHLPHVKALQAASSKRWYETRGKQGEAERRRSFRAERPLWSIYCGIKRRTTDKPDNSTPHWKHYGGRGIRMHEAWIGNYRLFETDVLRECGSRPSDRHSLDRIDNDGHYEPGNIRWADSRTQFENTRQRIALRERGVIRERLTRMEALIDDTLRSVAA